ncbi:large ribosomal subunit protein mL43-like [Tubulanus polymorphus]|uniref:large ribosomal subunit protein mL43-like n=1 Tax=Tubulanus polymorphus TaxID=672921 RepID=UPI003DA3B7D3
MTSSSIPSTFLKTVLKNGVGRYVCQMQRITFRFCKTHGDSRGMRDFIENSLLDFARKNPGVVVYLEPRYRETPEIEAEYLNGRSEKISTKCFNEVEICKWTEHLKNRSGEKIVRLRKMWHTDSPSIQGHWSPFTNKNPKLNITEFPNDELSRCFHKPSNATDSLLEMQNLVVAGESKSGAQTKQTV